MPTPSELAQLAEHLDDTQWYDFLEELDAVSRRRRHRQTEPEQPANGDRDSLAAWLARKHFLADSGIREIWYLPERAPADEIRLLEVSDRQAGAASTNALVDAIDFALDIQGCPYRLFVADVTSDQLEQIRKNRLPLPADWTLDRSTVWRRRS